jgi:chaperonin GroEL
MFAKALPFPIAQMAMNAGMFRPTLWQRIFGHKLPEIGYDIGWDFKNKKRVNMFSDGIIDPFKVVRLALESATAIASSLVSVETVIVTEPEEKDGETTR